MKPVLTFLASLLVCLGPTRPAFGVDIPPAAKELGPDIQRIDARVFADPPAEDRPAMLWFWRDTQMTEALIDRQLDLMKGIGIHRVCIFQRRSSTSKVA